MESRGNISHAVGLVSLLLTAAKNVAIFVTTAGTRYREARFGGWGWWLHFFRIVDTDLVQQHHWTINVWKDEEVLTWKSSYLASCNAITVAGSIFASIGLGALSLPNMDVVHWTARACFSSSMLLGILSVVFATSQQQTVGMLNNPLAIRLWLSRGGGDTFAYPPPFNGLPLESSISASKIIAIPGRLLNLAVFLFIVGFGLYVLFSWVEEATTTPSDYRNIFITFIVTAGTFGLYYVVWNMLRLYDNMRVTNQFDLRRLGGFPKGSPLQQLRDQLDMFQTELVEREIMVYSERLAIPQETSVAIVQEQTDDDSSYVVPRPEEKAESSTEPATGEPLYGVPRPEENVESSTAPVSGGQPYNAPRADEVKMY